MQRRIALLVVALACLGGCESKSVEQTAAANQSDTSSAIAAPTTSARTQAPASAHPASTCDATTITANGLGPIRIGAKVDSVKSLCNVVRDTTQLGGEGMMERRLTISLPAGQLDAEIVDGRVWRLDIRSAGFHTIDSLGVGSSLSDLLRRRDPIPAAGEGIVVVMLGDHCGMSFVLAGGFRSGVFRKWTADELTKLPGSTKVERVLVFGCRKSGG